MGLCLAHQTIYSALPCLGNTVGDNCLLSQFNTKIQTMSNEKKLMGHS